MNEPPLLVEVRNSLFPYFIAIGREGEFVHAGAVMFKNITSYLGEFFAAVCACEFLPGRVCRWRSRDV